MTDDRTADPEDRTADPTDPTDRTAPASTPDRPGRLLPTRPAPRPTPPRRRPRRRVVVALVAAGVVVVLAVVGVTLALRGGASPAATVRSYLQALAAGDATRALEQGVAPPDTTFVTRAALAAQREVAAVGAVSVDDGVTSGRVARVSATYTFGSRRTEASFSLTRVRDTWKLDHTVYPVDLTGLADVPGLTLQGVDVGRARTAYVFPGPLTWGTTDADLTVTASDAADYPVSPTDDAAAASTLSTGLSDRGEQAVAAAVRTHLAACAASTGLTPDGCPQAVYDYQAVAGSAHWTTPSDLTALAYRPGSPPTRVYVTGDLHWPVGYLAGDGSGGQKAVTADVDGPVYGTVDLTRDPPVFTP